MERVREMSVRISLVLTTQEDEEGPEVEEVVVWAESSLDPAVGFLEALERAESRLVTVMACETVVGKRLAGQVDVLAAKLEAAGA